MSIDMQSLIEQSEAQIAVLRKLYRFSEAEAQDFIEMCGDSESDKNNASAERSA